MGLNALLIAESDGERDSFELVCLANIQKVQGSMRSGKRKIVIAMIKEAELRDRVDSLFMMTSS